MKKILFVFVFSFCVNCLAEDRPAVLTRSEQPHARPVVRFDNEEEMVKRLFEKIKNSMEDGDFRKYMSCHTKEYANKNKKNASIMFVEHELTLDIDNFNIIESNEEEIELVVKYTTGYSGRDVVTVANVLCKKQDENLLVANQNIISQKDKNGNQCFNGQCDTNQNCANGQCNIPNAQCANGQCEAPVAKNRERKIALFNDANGKPDPNGIMWIDPHALIQAFPEEYPKCKNCK
jgi:hypothetical protein